MVVNILHTTSQQREFYYCVTLNSDKNLLAMWPCKCTHPYMVYLAATRHPEWQSSHWWSRWNWRSGSCKQRT